MVTPPNVSMSLMIAHPCFGPSAKLERISSSGSEAGPKAPVLLLTGLELVVAELPTSFGEGLAVVDRRANLLLDGVDLLGGCQHGVFVRERNDEHAVGIASYQVAGMHARVADVHRAVDRLDLHAVLAGAHRVAAAEDRIAQLARQRRVAARAVDDGAGDA